MNLNIQHWKMFKVSNIFTILNGKGITKEEISENSGIFPAVQSGEENNGVIGYIDFEYCKLMNYSYSKEPCLTVARTGSAGFVTYQEKGCVVGDSAKILKFINKKLSKPHYLFIQTLLNANRYKYSYGRKVTESKYMDDYLKLPIKLNSENTPTIDSEYRYSDEGYIPDWEFMEDYIKSLSYKPLSTKNKSNHPLNISKWKEFTILQLFDDVYIAKSADIGNLEEGNIPFVGRTDIDNGIQGFVAPISITESKCITISMVGTNVALYQENDFQASQNIAILRKEGMTKEIALFICSLINFEIKLKYSYGRTIGKTNIEQMVLNLPIDSNSNPNWQFMDNYIRSLPYGDKL